MRISDVWSYFSWNGNARNPSADTFGEAVLKTPDARQQWHSDGRRYRKPNPWDPSLVLERDESPGRTGRCRLVHVPAETVARDLGSLDWADWAKDGTLIFGDAGRLYRQQVRGERARKPSAPSLVADLTTQTFERIEAPEGARQWPRAMREAPRKKR